MRILGVRDLGLASEPQPLHGDAMRGIDMSPDDERAILGQDFVGAQDVGRRADLTAAEPIFRHAEQNEQMLHEPDAGPLGKDGQNVKPELRRELKPR